VTRASGARQRLADAPQASNAYWAEQVNIQRMAAAAWIADAEGRRAEALALMGSAVEREAGTEKHALTPGPLARRASSSPRCCSQPAGRQKR
jgi:hypothetical protein